MQIKKRKLIIVCSLLFLMFISGGVCYQKYARQRKEELELSKLKADYERAIKREYEILLRDYESIIETINDYSYSYDFRFEYVIKLNRLLNCRQYDNTGYSYTTVENCIDKQPLNKVEDLKLLKQKAQLKVFGI